MSRCRWGAVVDVQMCTGAQVQSCSDVQVQSIGAAVAVLQRCRGADNKVQTRCRGRCRRRFRGLEEVQRCRGSCRRCRRCWRR